MFQNGNTVDAAALNNIASQASNAEATAKQARETALDIERRANEGEFKGEPGKDGQDGIDGAPGKDGAQAPAENGLVKSENGVLKGSGIKNNETHVIDFNETNKSNNQVSKSFNIQSGIGAGGASSIEGYGGDIVTTAFDETDNLSPTYRVSSGDVYFDNFRFEIKSYIPPTINGKPIATQPWVEAKIAELTAQIEALKGGKL